MDVYFKVEMIYVFWWCCDVRQLIYSALNSNIFIIDSGPFSSEDKDRYSRYGNGNLELYDRQFERSWWASG